MLDRIGDVDRVPLNSGQAECLIKDPACRSNKRLTGDIFFVTRLLSDKQKLCRLFSASENRLRRISP